MHPLFELALLGVESVSVICKRLNKIGRGDPHAADEIHLMVTEKVDAAIEATTALMRGGSPTQTIARYREHVASNDARLSNWRLA
jgi:hypothetical protein